MIFYRMYSRLTEGICRVLAHSKCSINGYYCHYLLHPKFSQEINEAKKKIALDFLMTLVYISISVISIIVILIQKFQKEKNKEMKSNSILCQHRALTTDVSQLPPRWSYADKAKDEYVDLIMQEIHEYSNFNLTCQTFKLSLKIIVMPTIWH